MEVSFTVFNVGIGIGESELKYTDVYCVLFSPKVKVTYNFSRDMILTEFQVHSLTTKTLDEELGS